jgi:hypothetical protein
VKIDETQRLAYGRTQLENATVARQKKEPQPMRKAALIAFTAFLCAGILMTPILAAQNETTFTGEINDRACAKANSHDAMMKRHGSTNEKDCIVACVKAGGKYVLVDSATKAIYLLDDQQKPEAFAGQKVKITGTYDKATETLHIATIQPAA